MLFCRCAARGSVLASFDGGSLSRDFRPSHLCPISGVQDRCVWIGLLKPWFFWPNPSMLIVFIFKYLGHIIFSNMTYIMKSTICPWEQICLYDVLLNALRKSLFKSYRLSLSVWCLHNAGYLIKLKLCYHKCIKMFFSFKRRNSVTQIPFDLSLPTILSGTTVMLFSFMLGVIALICLYLTFNGWFLITVLI